MTYRIIFLLIVCPLFASSQCLENYQKLFPDKTASYPESFGNSIAFYDDFMAVGAVNSDTLAYHAGIVYLYQRTAGSWKRIGVITPSAPVEQMSFGYQVRMTADYILVGCTPGKPGVYIFRKPTGGWTSATETTYLTNGSSSFGSYFDISPDQQTLAVSDISTGSVYVYHKSIAQEWDTSIIPQQVAAAESAPDGYLLGTDVRFINNHSFAYTTNPYVDLNKDQIYVFSDHTSGFTNFQWEAKLTDNFVGVNYGPSFSTNSEGIFRVQGARIIFYATPVNEVWQNANPTCTIPIDPIIDGYTIESFYINYKATTDAIDFVVRLTDRSTRVVRLTKSGATWCDGVIRKIISSEPAPLPGATQLQVRSFDSNGTNTIVYAWTFTEDTPLNAVGVATLFNENNVWTRGVLAKGINSASNTNFGKRLWQQGKFLFVTATKEKNGGDQVGKVYVYKKNNDSWTFIKKLGETPADSDDEGYGGSITGVGNELAIAAYLYKPAKIFMYQGDRGDFSNPILKQTLEFPAEKKIDSYSLMKMNSSWLVVPVTYGAENSLIFYKKNPTTGTWLYSYDTLIGYSNPFFKQSPSIDMDEQTLVAGVGGGSAIVMELDQAKEKWIIKATLRASDPDQDEFILDPKWPVIRMDGSYFGYQVRLTDNTIFITAPGKNDEPIKDVGAVYLYINNSGKGWASGYETKKILPDVRTASGLFGSYIDAFGNTMATSAIKSGAPGTVFIFQTEDYSWSNVRQVMKRNGDTSSGDNFGSNISLGKNDFVISAYIESNTAGTESGTVYVSKFSTILRVPPPVCESTVSVNLDASISGGTWSGKGITNDKEGKFAPATAGAGIHQLTYIAPGCSYENKVNIEVKPAISAITSVSQKQTLCGAGNTSTVISIQKDASLSYRWSYSSNQIDYNVLPNDTTFQKKVTSDKTGQYKVEFHNSYCSSNFIFDIALEELQLELQPLQKICDSTRNVVKLKANYAGGVWSMNDSNLQSLFDQAAGTLNALSLVNNTYSIRYDYVSKNQCKYNKSQSLTIERLPAIKLTRTGNLCLDGSVTLSTQKLDNDYKFTWTRLDKDSLVEEGNMNSYVSTTNGTYGVVVENPEGCKVQSSSISINEVKSDNVFIPNVFTPNKDGKNEYFKITSTPLSSVKLSIVDRYGSIVFKGNGNQGWDGKDAPAGTYYWLLSYTGCGNDKQELKGYLQLVK